MKIDQKENISNTMITDFMAMTNYVRWKQAKRKREKKEDELAKATGVERKHWLKHLKDLKKMQRK